MNPFLKAQRWYEAVYQCQQQGQGYVIITVLSAAGSTPREAGAKMVVTVDGQFDTIGGGHLEYVSIEKARQLLINGKQSQSVESFPLAAKLGQCCGGAVKVLFETHVHHGQTLAVFGGGHVAQSLVPILTQLPLQIRWVDNRPPTFDTSVLPSNVTCLFNDDAVSEMEHLPTNAWTIILTHNHQLDYELVEQGLKHNQLGFLGMIGSDTKAERFRLRLQNRGFKQSQIETLVSPIGALSVQGKRPVEVAVSISAQIINLLNGIQPNSTQPNTKPLTTETVGEQTI